jgi:serine/threonine protein kinase
MSVQKIGRYEITGELGKGAMGVVYKATDPTIGRTVALKTMRLDVHAERGEDMLRRFQNEARAAGALNHPNIVTIYDAGEADGIFYIAMEYIEGTTLFSLLRDRRSLSAQELVDIGSQICAGLQYAHFRKVVHRDIKPANIMLAPGGTLKIMDFGIAQAGSSLTRTGEVLGTPHYMSPEQVKGRELDGRTDIFSMGVVLYEMITGEKPFDGQNVTTIIYKIVNATPIPPRELDVSIHPGISAIISKCLAKDPDDRYQEASDLATALKSYKIISIPSPKIGAPMAPRPAFHVNATQPISAPGAKPATFAGPRTGVATKPSVVSEAPSIAVTTKPQATSSEARKTVTLFLVLAAVLVAGAVVFRTITHKAAPTVLSQPAPSQPLSPADDRIHQAANEAAEGVKQPTAEQLNHVNIAPPPVPGVGDLRVTSNPPGAQVTVDGTTQDYYVTPFNTPPLQSGMHTLTATAPGFPSQTRQVQVRARERTVVDFQLAGDKAIYNIASAPLGADIIVDGTPTGSSTPAQITLKPGPHRITLRMEGFDSMDLMTQSTPGETVSIAPTLQAHNSVDISGPAQESPSLGALARMRRWANNAELPTGNGAVVIRTRPKGATIVVNGRVLQRMTPMRFPVPPGSYTVTLQKPGYQPVTRVVQVQEGQISEVDELLLPQQ